MRRPIENLGIARRSAAILRSFGVSRLKQNLLSNGGRQFSSKAVRSSRRNVVNNLSDLFVAKSLNQLFLVLQTEIFKHVGGQLPRQDAQQHGFIISLEVGENLSQFGSGKAAQNFAQRGEIALWINSTSSG